MVDKVIKQKEKNEDVDILPVVHHILQTLS